MGLEVDDKEFDQLVDRVAKKITKGLSLGLAKSMDHIGSLAVGKFMINPGGEGKPVDSKRITSRSGDTARSLLPQGGARTASGNREQIRKIKVSRDRIDGVFGTRAKGGVHETGATIHQEVTEQQRKFFWAKYFESGFNELFKGEGQLEDKWKWAALSKSITIEIPARPFLGPAVDAGLNQVYNIMDESLADVLI